jgi:hypothetical protein
MGSLNKQPDKTEGSTLSTQGRQLDRNANTAEAPSVTYAIDQTKRIVSVKFGIRVSVRDIANYATSLRENPLFDPDFSELVDLREVKELEVGAEQALKLADDIDPFSPGAKRAFVAQSSAPIYAARLHMLLRSASENIRIFESIDDAILWLRS